MVGLVQAPTATRAVVLGAREDDKVALGVRQGAQRAARLEDAKLPPGELRLGRGEEKDRADLLVLHLL